MNGEPIPVFGASVTAQHSIRLDEPETFRSYLRRFEGQRIQVVVRRPTRPRSGRQQRYYWGVIVALLAEHCGYEPEEMHEALKWRFLRTREDDGLPTVKSTTKLTTVEAEDYYERIRRWAAIDLGVHLPLPHEAEAA